MHFRKNSVFNSVFTCKGIASADLQELSINLSLHSQDRFGQSHFVGEVVMKFSEVNFNPSEPVYFWRPVQRKVRGFISRVEKVSDHRTIGPRKFFEFPENISPRKKNIIVKI